MSGTPRRPRGAHSPTRCGTGDSWTQSRRWRTIGVDVVVVSAATESIVVAQAPGRGARPHPTRPTDAAPRHRDVHPVLGHVDAEPKTWTASHCVAGVVVPEAREGLDTTALVIEGQGPLTSTGPEDEVLRRVDPWVDVAEVHGDEDPPSCVLDTQRADVSVRPARTHSGESLAVVVPVDDLDDVARRIGRSPHLTNGARCRAQRQAHRETRRDHHAPAVPHSFTVSATGASASDTGPALVET